MKLYGVASTVALLKKRPKAVLRLFLRADLEKKFAPFNLPYKIVTNHELEKLTESVHHEGVCVCIAKPKPEYVEEHWANFQKKGCLIFLDHSLNPHNLGAIIRSSAHFNIKWILSPVGANLPPSGFRIAKGGAEHVSILHYKDKMATLTALKKLGYRIYATSSHTGSPLHKTSFPDKSVIILGGESEGITPGILKMADEPLTIQGTGFVESLNVSAAFCMIAGKYYYDNCS